MSNAESKTLERKRHGRMLAGVAAGLGTYFGIDPNVVRLAFAVASFFGGFGVLVYVVAWAVVPEEGETESIVERLVNKNQPGAGPPPADPPAQENYPT
jgi:phage shock protein PspC (stress-responsive transcriptional regulator)